MIDSRAIIDPLAEIDSSVTIGPFSVIGSHVRIQSGTIIGPHVVINGPTSLGKNNKVFQFASIGESPQDKKYAGEDTLLEIGDGNLIREFCTINRGTVGGGGLTKIGNNNLFMSSTHIAHDCFIGHDNVFANYMALAGHVIVENNIILSAYSAVHQFCHVGAYSFIGAGTLVRKDVLPFLLVEGHEAKTYGINKVGLKRNNFTDKAISTLQQAYKIIFRNGLTVEEAIAQVTPLIEMCPAVEEMIRFLKQSRRGVIR